MVRRKSLERAQQVAIFRRDRWMCRWCRLPVIFAPALKYLQMDVQRRGYSGKLAYFHPNFTRYGAPLLDQFAAVLDHVEAASRSGLSNPENLVTSCNKCNMTKSDAAADTWERKRRKPKPIKSKYGEPTDWDGFSSVFVVLAEQFPTELTTAEKDWLIAFKRE